MNTGRSLGETWAQPGTPGHVEGMHLGTSLPLAYLGLVAGGVVVRDDMVPQPSPWPGVDEPRQPLAWYDSSAVVIGGDAGWRGFGASLVELRLLASPPRGAKPRAAFTYQSGSAALDRNSLKLERGDPDGWLRGGSLGDRRSEAGTLGPRGDHVWFLDAARLRGAHTWRAAYSQRGSANSTRAAADANGFFGGLAPYRGFEEAARGEAGYASWEWQRGVRHASLRLRRGHDHRESSESPVRNTLFIFAEREAQQNSATLEFGTRTGGHETGARLEFTQAQVRRSPDFLNSLDPVDARQRTAWLAVRHARPWAGGRLEAQTGVGLQSAPSDGGERLQAAPSLEWERGAGVTRVRLHAGRIVTPVWSDLAPGVRAFTQDAWVAGLEAGVGQDARQWLRAGVLGASAGARARLARFSVRDLSLRYGWTPDERRMNDVMGMLETGLERGPVRLEASGFARVRPRVGFEALSEPAVGARGAVQTAFKLFTGDLGVMFRLEAGWVGEREFASLPEYFAPLTTLAGHMTYDGVAMIDLGDARIAVRALTLEDRAWEGIWADPSEPQPGKPALGPGRQIRVEVAWPFFN